ncbi:MAG: AraC family transcriptional regulator [Stagnimonas sp.]|nr:AraC family transcriptional regulator [Stagnimonas sp.]
MARSELRVPARYYLRLAEELSRQGIDITALLAALQLPPQLLQEPDALLPFADVDRLVTRFFELTGRSELGFELGRQLHVSSHSLVGFGMLSSPNLEAALRFVARHFRLVMPSFRLLYSAGADWAELHFQPVAAMSHVCLAFHLEAMATAALRDVHDLTGGQAPPCRLQLSIARPPHAARYERLGDVVTEFAAGATPGVRLRFLADLAGIPLRLADPNALKVAEARCDAQVRRATRQRQFADWVAMSLREVSEGLPTLAELAAMLNLSARSLNRYLEREGTSYRALAGRIQHELACERLASGAMTVTEVAYSLGFSDPANFTRAFRDREGASPRDYQQRLRPA